MNEVDFKPHPARLSGCFFNGLVPLQLELTSGLNVISNGDSNSKLHHTCKLCQRGRCSDDHRWTRSVGGLNASLWKSLGRKMLTNENL